MPGQEPTADGGWSTRRANRDQAVVAMLLLAVAIILGGGGSPAPLAEMGVQFAGFLALAAWAFVSPRALPAAPASAWLLAGLLMALPLVQLVPMPPVLWHALPGREVERAALALVGGDGDWRPLSMVPGRTLASLLALTTPVVALLMVSSLGTSARTMIVGMTFAGAILSLLVGAGQLAGGGDSALRFYVRDVPYLSGFQANRNSQADVLLIGMVAGVAVWREWVLRHRPTMRPAVVLGAAAAMVFILSLGVGLTASRAGIFLLPVAWLAAGAIIHPWWRIDPTRVRWILIGGGITVAGVTALLATSGAVRRVAERFRFEGEFRPELWRDAAFAAKQYFPFGSGTGTFVPVFVASERLEVVDPSLPNRAHNELLEILVESGVFGLIVAALVVGLVFRALIKRLRAKAPQLVGQTYFAAAALAVIAIHSQVDYPLRSMSLACIAAACAGLLMAREDRINQSNSSV